MTHKQRKVAEAKSEIIADVPLACADESAAVAFWERLRWGDVPCCPRCGDTKVRKILSKKNEHAPRFLWRCYGCKAVNPKQQQYTWRTGTVAEDSRIPARCWAYAMWRATTSKKGVAALEIKRQTGLSYKSALFLMHRIRFGMGSGRTPRPMLDGQVQADETYCGGKPRARRTRKQGWTKDKTPVFGVRADDGILRLRVMPTVNVHTVGRALRRFVDPSAQLVTDEAVFYPRVGKRFAGGHETVCHKRREYVRDGFTTNGIEGVFSLLKRGLYGIWHNVSPTFLPLYLNEVEFRYNHKGGDDGDRLRAAVRAMDGKRLTYDSRRAAAYNLRLW